MSKFKLKHQSKSGLLYQEVVKKAPEPQWSRLDRYMEPPKKIVKEYTPTTELPIYKPEPLQPMPRFRDPDKKRLIPEFEPIRVDVSKERNRIKYENQERRRAEEDAMRRKMMENYIQQTRDFDRRLDEMRLIEANKPVRVYRDHVTEPSVGVGDKIYDRFALGKDVDSSLQMIKNNSAAPYKLPHQSKSALYNNGFVGSGGKLTDDERAEANRLLDSVRGTYMDREFKTGRMIRGEDGAFITGPDGKRVREKIMLTPEENQREYDMEIGDYYVDFDKSGKAKVLNVPRGDDDIPVQSFIESLDPSQYRGYIPKPEDLPEDYYDPGLDPNSTLNPFKGYQRIENYRER